MRKTVAAVLPLLLLGAASFAQDPPAKPPSERMRYLAVVETEVDA